MKADTNIFCNLCQKSVNYEGFQNHVSSDHLPKLNLTCPHCESQQASLAALQFHLNSLHKSDDLVRNVFQFSDLFTSCSDISSHSKKCAEWIQKSFSIDAINILDKKEIRSVIKRSYTHIHNEYNNDCELCDNEENHSHCGYCSREFLRKCHLKVHLLRNHLSLPDHIKRTLNICEDCGKIYPTKNILKQHYITHNKRVTRKRIKYQKKQVPQTCNFCDKKISNRSNLKRHLVRQHRTEIDAPPSYNLFTCDHCKCEFSNKSSVKRHIENLHMIKKSMKKNISCFHCDQEFNSIKNLNAHLTISHQVKINEEKLQFYHLNEFYTWKQEEEIRTNSRFIQLRGLRKQCNKKGEERSVLKFVCNRSGMFHSRSNGKRAYRVKGSSKIGRYCSAYIDIVFEENGSVNGVYCSTHSGHDNDLRYLTLTMDEKREIYERIKSGESFASILNEIRNDVGKEIKRKHLVTNKDLHNIVATFKRISHVSQDDNSAQSSSNQLESSNDPSIEKCDQNFNNDLDLCADLWVETCQRMVHRFDQNELRTNAFCKDPKPRNTCLITDTHKQDSSCNADFHRAPYLIHHDYSSSSPPNCMTDESYKPTNYHDYQNETVKNLNNSTTCFNNVAKSANAKQVKEFCNVSAISNGIHLNKDFYPIDIVDVDNHRSKSSVEYNNDAIDDSQAHFRNTHPCDTLPSNTNTIIIRNQDPYSYNSDKLPSTSNSESEHVIHSIDDNDFSDTEVVTCNDTSILENESETLAENKDDHEVSDLRDRVNSVTALFNMVESELDDRKKKIIRNYVDNIFRVLQYRYIKRRSKKKQDSQKQPPNKEKNLKNRLPSKDKKRKKKVSDIIPNQLSDSSEFVSKVSHASHTNPLNSSTIENLARRPDAEFMRWDRY